MAAAGLRNLVKRISPPWLQKGNAEKTMYAIAYVTDALIEKLYQATLARMPTRTQTTTTLAEIGVDRDMPRGIAESDETYALRLQRAFDDWRFAGMARGVLAQVIAYLSVAANARSVSQSSRWDEYADNADISEAPTHTVASPPNWDWDSVSNPTFVSRWWRRWLILEPTNAATGVSWTSTEGTWGDGDLTGNDTKSIGLSVSADVVSSFRSLVKKWKSANTHYLWIIVPFANLFDVTMPSGDPGLPDGTWGPWSKRVVNADGVPQRVPTRSDDARYIEGVI